MIEPIKGSRVRGSKGVQTGDGRKRQRDTVLDGEPWSQRRELGLCWNSDSSKFFPPRDEATVSARESKELCARCPVKPDCAHFAIVNNLRFGIWGGTSVRDRERIKKNAKEQED